MNIKTMQMQMLTMARLTLAKMRGEYHLVTSRMKWLFFCDVSNADGCVDEAVLGDDGSAQAISTASLLLVLVLVFSSMYFSVASSVTKTTTSTPIFAWIFLLA